MFGKKERKRKEIKTQTKKKKGERIPKKIYSNLGEILVKNFVKAS